MDPSYFQETADGRVVPTKTWCFYAEVVDNSLSQVGRGGGGREGQLPQPGGGGAGGGRVGGREGQRDSRRTGQLNRDQSRSGGGRDQDQQQTRECGWAQQSGGGHHKGCQHTHQALNQLQLLPP
jgi:hypothetical protein